MTSKWKAVAYWNLRGRQERTEKSHPDNGTLQGCKAAATRYWECDTRAERRLLRHNGLGLSSKQCLLKAGRMAGGRREIPLRESGPPFQEDSRWSRDQSRRAYRPYKASGSSLSLSRKAERTFILFPLFFPLDFSPIFWRWNWDIPFSRAGSMSMRFRISSCDLQPGRRLVALGSSLFSLALLAAFGASIKSLSSLLSWPACSSHYLSPDETPKHFRGTCLMCLLGI